MGTIADVRALHLARRYSALTTGAVTVFDGGTECCEDEAPWPCRTIRTLDACGDDDVLARTLMFTLHQPVRRFLRGLRCTADADSWPCRTAALLNRP